MAHRPPPSLRLAEAVEERLRRFAPVWLLRAAYRSGHVVLRALWFFTRPDSAGVKLVVRRGPDVLLVRHTYGARGWDLPGGTAREGEDPVRTAQRELQEELGLEATDPRSLGVLRLTLESRRSTIHSYAIEIDHSTPLTPDRAELAEVAWWPAAALPPGTAAVTCWVVSQS